MHGKLWKVISQLTFSSAIQRYFSLSLLDLALLGREIPVLDEAGLLFIVTILMLVSFTTEL